MTRYLRSELCKTVEGTAKCLLHTGRRAPHQANNDLQLKTVISEAQSKTLRVENMVPVCLSGIQRENRELYMPVRSPVSRENS